MINNLFYIISATSFTILIMFSLIIFSFISLKKKEKILKKIKKK